MRRTRSARSSPRMYSIEMKCSPSTSPTSYTRQTLGCETWRAILTSFSSRVSRVGSAASRWGRNLSATACPSFRSSAR